MKPFHLMPSELRPDNSMLVVVHPHNNECCAKTGLGTSETEAAVDRIASIIPAFRKAGVPVRICFAAEPGSDPHKAFGGIHPKIAVTLDPREPTYQAFHPSVFAAPELRQEMRVTFRRHAILAGFNLSDCLGKSAIMARTHAEMGQDVTILRDASADRSDIAIAEMYNDCGGESMMSLMRRALNISMESSRTVMQRLGIAS